jgi:spore coat polysaccharide biosynthesis protein SpsF
MIGDEGDVLSRFCEVIEEYEPDGIIRVCADNPFIQLPLMFPVTAWIEDNDYVAFDHCMGRKEGFWIEYVKSSALLDANNRAKTDYDREHVTPFICRFPSIYNIKWLPIPPELKKYKIHLTVDTKKDFERAREVYYEVGEKHWYYIIDYFHNKNIEVDM